MSHCYKTLHQSSGIETPSFSRQEPGVFLFAWQRNKAILFCCCPALLRPRRPKPARLYCLWDFPGKSTGVGCHFLLQGIFLTQGSNPQLPHWQADFLPYHGATLILSGSGVQRGHTWVTGMEQQTPLDSSNMIETRLPWDLLPVNSL